MTKAKSYNNTHTQAAKQKEEATSPLNQVLETCGLTVCFDESLLSAQPLCGIDINNLFHDPTEEEGDDEIMLNRFSKSLKGEEKKDDIFLQEPSSPVANKESENGDNDNNFNDVKATPVPITPSTPSASSPTKKVKKGLKQLTPKLKMSFKKKENNDDYNNEDKNNEKHEDDSEEEVAAAAAEPKKKKKGGFRRRLRRSSKRKDTEASPENSSGSDNGDDDTKNDKTSQQDEENLDDLLDQLEIPDEGEDFLKDDDDDAHNKNNNHVTKELDIGDDSDTKNQHSRKFEEAPAQNWDHWNQVWNREEVYSTRYRANPNELKQVSRLEKALNSSSAWNPLATQVNLHEDILQSVPLIRGMVNYEDVDFSELIVTTKGFVLVQVNLPVKAKSWEKVPRKLLHSDVWTNLRFIKVDDDEETDKLEIVIETKSSPISFSVDTLENYQQWSSALEHIVIQMALHNKQVKKTRLGWEYTLVHKPGFTSAVTGDLLQFGKRRPNNWNCCDKYNGHAPLHYAVLNNHIVITEFILVQQQLPDIDIVNFPDKQKHTAMYYAVHNELKEMQALLLEHGANKADLVETQARGALFGSVQEAERRTEKRRELEAATAAAEAKAKAESAATVMSQNMSALQERGEKIEELDMKTKELQENAMTYKDLTSQLKDKVKKQGNSWW